MIHQSRVKSIQEEIDSNNNPRHTWRILNKLLHRNIQQHFPDDKCQTLANSFNHFFINKIQGIHDNIKLQLSSNDFSHENQNRLRPNLNNIITTFSDVTPLEIHHIITHTCHKSSPLDSFPHHVLINCVDTISIAIAQLTNLSFKEGHFPTIYKTAQILPILKKPNLDNSLLSNFRPISNLNTISKIIERTVLNRLQPHITSNSNYTTYQSAYRPYHSTETALLHILDHAFNACDSKSVTILASLDLSAAFDTISHKILIERLEHEFGVSGTALSWLSSYLLKRSQFVKLGNHISSTISLQHGVPQGSVLGPLLFTTYISPISNIIQQQNMSFHHYADDTQLFHSIKPNDLNHNTSIISNCFKSILSWFLQNNLQLNPTKTELIMLGTTHQLSLLSNATSIFLNDTPISFQKTMKTLGVILDQKLTFSSQISSIIQSCNHHLRAISHIRQFLTLDLAATLSRCLVLSRLDYCNSLLFGISNLEISRLQRVMNRAARITLNIPSYQHHLNHSSIDNLRTLHWLPLPHRINFKIAIITYKIKSTSSPPYLNNLIASKIPSRNTRSSKAPLLMQQLTTNNISTRAFRHTAPTVWNSLPAEIRNMKTLASFKSNLKTYYFNIAFNT